MAFPVATIRGNNSREIHGSSYHSPTAYASVIISIHDTNNQELKNGKTDGPPSCSRKEDSQGDIHGGITASHRLRICLLHKIKKIEKFE